MPSGMYTDTHKHTTMSKRVNIHKRVFNLVVNQTDSNSTGMCCLTAEKQVWREEGKTCMSSVCPGVLPLCEPTDEAKSPLLAS